MASVPPSVPRKSLSPTFVEIGTNEKIEGETISTYRPETYYPAHIGDVFHSRYKIVSKLGFGVNSTVWLCRDLWKHRFLTLKLRVRANHDSHVNLHHDHEIATSEHLKNVPIEHPGKKMVRAVVDSFQISGPHGTHTCLLYQPLGMTFTEFLDLLPQHRLPKELFQRSVQLLLIALDYLHQCNVVHTDISPNNVLQDVEDHAILSDIEEGELEQPVARKVLSDRTIYNSRQ